MNEKPLKTCQYCGKDVKGLGLHIINAHPKIMEQLDEMTPQTPPQTPNSYAQPRGFEQNRPADNINAMIREKLDTMLNIKIIEMLSKSPNTSIQEISTALNPPQKTTLQELKEYHDLVYGERERDIEIPETGNQWVDLATAAIPLIKEMLPAKKRQMEEEQNDKPRANEERSLRILKPIQEKTPGNTGESGSFSHQPGVNSETEQQNASNPRDIDKRAGG